RTPRSCCSPASWASSGRSRWPATASRRGSNICRSRSCSGWARRWWPWSEPTSAPGAPVAAAATGTFGLWGALFPYAWLGLFTREPAVVATGSAYLRIVGPVYGFFGVGLALYFASQGAGRLRWPLTASAVRLVVAVGGAWLGGRVLGGGLTIVFVAM